MILELFVKGRIFKHGRPQIFLQEGRNTMVAVKSFSKTLKNAKQKINNIGIFIQGF